MNYATCAYECSVLAGGESVPGEEECVLDEDDSILDAEEPVVGQKVDSVPGMNAYCTRIEHYSLG